MTASRQEELRARHGRGLRAHAAHGTIVNSIFLIGLSGVGLVRGFLLAGLLSTTDYGIWGILIVSIGTIAWLKQAGIGDKFVQQDEPDQELAFQKAFTLELIWSGLLVAVMAAALPLIAGVVGEPELIAPGLVLLLLLPAAALQAPLWIHYRNMDFVRQRTLQAIDPLVAFAVAVTLAVLGAGYWALAIGVTAGAWAAAAAAVAFSPYRLRLRYDRGTLGRYFSFSWPLIVASGSGMVIAQSAVLATEAELGLAGAGAITLASNITAFTQRVDEVVTGTLYPAVAAVRDRLELLRESFVKSNRLALIWAMPFGVALALFAGDLVAYGIGEKWRPAVVLLEVYGVTAALGHVAYNWDAYLRAVGRTRPIAVASAASMVTFLAVGLPLLFAFGLPGLAAGVAIQSAVHVALRIHFLRSVFQDFRVLAHASRAILPTIPPALAVLAVRQFGEGRGAGRALAELALYVVLVSAATWALERRLLRELGGYLVRRRSVSA